MIFCDPGTLVFEVTTRGTGNFYLMMAAALGMKFYGYVVRKMTHKFVVNRREFVKVIRNYL